MPTIVVWVGDSQTGKFALWQSTTVADPRAKSIKISKTSVFDEGSLPKLQDMARNWTGTPRVPILKNHPLGPSRVRDVRNAAWEYFSNWRELGSYSPRFGQVDITLKAWRHLTRASSSQREIIHKLSLLICAKELIEKTSRSTLFRSGRDQRNELHLLRGICSKRYREDILVEVILEASMDSQQTASTKLYSIHERRRPW